MRLNAKELIAEARMTAPTLPSAAAKLMTAMADRLDLQFVALCESRNEVKQLAAENTALKSGVLYFSCGSEHHFEWHKTAEEAVEAAIAAIDDYRGDACDGWSEEVDSICWGIIMQSSTKVGERPRNKNDSCDPAIDTVCDYALLPNIETPATDAYTAALRAEARKQGAVFAANRMLAAWDAGFVEDTPENAADIARAILISTEFMDEAPDGDFDRSYADEMLEAIASQLRSKSNAAAKNIVGESQ
ncbi:ead/Ea22-like family protein [Enterobacter asburiae]|nr:ead/Ea22-like family protein [Enterobacter asburiae]